MIEVGANKPVKSIKKAIISAKVGDTILVHKGVYKEGNIVIDKATFAVKDKIAFGASGLNKDLTFGTDTQNFNFLCNSWSLVCCLDLFKLYFQSQKNTSGFG